MLLKPCKVKRFLATAALSEVGFVSSDSQGQRVDQRGHKRGKDKMSYTLGETKTDKRERQKKEEGLTSRHGADDRCVRQTTTAVLQRSPGLPPVSPFPAALGEQEELASDSAFFSSPFLKLF